MDDPINRDFIWKKNKKNPSIYFYSIIVGYLGL